MAKKRKTAAKKASRKPARRRSSAKNSGLVSNDTFNALLILVVIALAIAGIYFYMQKAKAEPAFINVSPAVVSIAPK